MFHCSQRFDAFQGVMAAPAGESHRCAPTGVGLGFAFP
jgi:hypothetical protein